jgi:hypothetical protein
MGLAALQAEHVAREMEGVDLATAVSQQLAGADRAGNHPVEDAARRALGEDLRAALEAAAGAEGWRLAAPRHVGGAAQGDGGGNAGCVGGAGGLHRSLLEIVPPP